MMGWIAIVGVLFGLLAVMLLLKGLWAIWHKMHALVGIEVGTPTLTFEHSQALGYEPGMALPNARLVSQKLPLTVGRTQHKAKKSSKQTYWHTRHGKIPALHYLNVSASQLALMPWEAVQLLLSIDERLARYAAWQHSQSTLSTATTPAVTTLSHNWLSEKQFVLQRLVDQTIPEAVQQFDQLARFNPQSLNQPIYDGMLPAQVLLAVLSDVSRQIDDWLDELSCQVGTQLATTYRYVKTRTQ